MKEIEYVVSVPATVGMSILIEDIGDEAENRQILQEVLHEAIRGAERMLDRQHNLVIEDYDVRDLEIIDTVR